MELMGVINAIKAKINELDFQKNELPILAQEKAAAATHYTKQLALALMGLRSGKKYIIDEEEVSNVPTTVMVKVSEGVCWQAKMDLEIAESKYRNAIEIIRILEAQLNAYQSINKHLSEA